MYSSCAFDRLTHYLRKFSGSLNKYKQRNIDICLVSIIIVGMLDPDWDTSMRTFSALSAKLIAVGRGQATTQRWPKLVVVDVSY